MSSAQAKKIVLVAAAVSGLLASIKPVASGDLSKQDDREKLLRIALGAVLVAVILLVLADVQPQLAGAFGYLVLISALFAVGPGAYQTLTVATKGTKK